MVVSGYRAWLLQAGPAFETLALFGTELQKSTATFFFNEESMAHMKSLWVYSSTFCGSCGILPPPVTLYS